MAPARRFRSPGGRLAPEVAGECGVDDRPARASTAAVIEVPDGEGRDAGDRTVSEVEPYPASACGPAAVQPGEGIPEFHTSLTLSIYPGLPEQAMLERPKR